MYEKLQVNENGLGLNRVRDMEPLEPDSASSKPDPAVLATLDTGDLHKFQEQRRIVSDQAKLLSMLRACYTSFLTDIQAKYDVPENISVNMQTGEVRKVQSEETDV